MKNTSILAQPSKPANAEELVDKKRITPKQALFIRNMCDEISIFLEKHPLVVTEARAHRIIEALKPSWEVIVEYKKAHDRITNTLSGWEDEEDEGFGPPDINRLEW